MSDPTYSTSSRRRSGEDLDRQLDQAIEDSFPTSDPVSLAMPHRRPERSGIDWPAALPLLLIGGIALALMLRRPRN